MTADIASPKRGKAGPPRRAAGYVRVSQVGGREGDSFLSPDVQREKIEAWATYRGFELVAWYVDLDRPAKERDVRPEFDRMMADAKAGKFEAVAVYRLTRFARSVSQAAARYADLRDAGVDLVSVTEDFDTSTSSGRLVQNMLFALAEFESQRIGEEWRAVHAARRRRGIAHVARPMYGYVTEGAVIVATDPAEARMVRELFNLRLRGRNLGELQDWLEDNGYRPKRGGDRLAKTTIRAMLKNPAYAGLVRADGELIDAAHEAIVSREVWDAVQATWARTTTMSRSPRPGLLSGLLVCSGCGYRMRFEGVNGRYRCKWRDLSRHCDRPVTIKATLAEEHVEQAFLRRFDPRRMPKKGRIKRRSRQQEKWQRKVDTLRRRAAEITRALDELADRRYVKGTASAEEYERQVERFLAERQLVQDEAARLEEAIGTTRVADVEALELWPALKTTQKRQALALLIHEIIVKPANGRLQPAAQRLDIGWLE